MNKITNKAVADFRRSVTCNTCMLICLGIRLTGVSVLNMLKTSDNSTTRDILVMFSELGVTFRVLANKEVLNVMPIIGNERLKGILSGTHQNLGHFREMFVVFWIPRTRSVRHKLSR